MTDTDALSYDDAVAGRKAPAERLTVSEYAESLTGFDELAIETHMGFSPYDGEKTSDGIKTMRAMVFIAKLREGLVAPQAREAAMQMTGKQLNEFFAEDDDELAELAGTDESGKDGPQPA